MLDDSALRFLAWSGSEEARSDDDFCVWAVVVNSATKEDGSTFCAFLDMAAELLSLKECHPSRISEAVNLDSDGCEFFDVFAAVGLASDSVDWFVLCHCRNLL